MNNSYLSIVVVGRNDNYGGDFVQRLQQFFDWNVEYLEKCKISSEIIFVNWNPIKKKQPIEDLIKFPTDRKYTKIRIITVPGEIHEKYVNSDVRKTVPIFEFIAKNTGIRRASGEYILCVNADVLIHPKIFRFIANSKLDKKYYYRANRIDFKTPKSISLKEIFKVSYIVSLKGFQYRFGNFFDKNLQYHFFRLLNTLKIAWEFWKLRNEAFCNYFGISVTYNNATYYTHCLNSGDFLLMNKKNWQTLRSYPEYTYISTHTDSVFMIIAYSSLKEYILRTPVFHQEHDRRYTWSAIKKEKMFIDAVNFFEDMAKIVIRKQNNTDFLNNKDWGLNGVFLPEKKI